MRIVLPGSNSYSVTVRPRCLSLACKIRAKINKLRELYTVPTEMRSALQASTSWSAVNGWGSMHTCSNTILRTLDGRMLFERM